MALWALNSSTEGIIIYGCKVHGFRQSGVAILGLPILLLAGKYDSRSRWLLLVPALVLALIPSTGCSRSRWKGVACCHDTGVWEVP